MKLFICLNLRHYNETPTGTTHTFETPRMQLHAYIYSSDDEKGHWAFRPKNVRIGGPQLTMRTRLRIIQGMFLKSCQVTLNLMFFYFLISV